MKGRNKFKVPIFVSSYHRHPSPCPVCHGSGKYNDEKCHGCHGRGWVSS